VLLLFLISYPILQAQVPHGGYPLKVGAEAEATSSLRSTADYFVDMPSFDADSAKAVDDLPGNRVGGLRFAHTFFTDLSPENSGLVFHTDDGTMIWKVGIRSSGAYSLNVLFSEFTLPEGAQVFLYNSDRSRVLGAFTRENRPDGGELSVAPVEGDELTVEYHEPANAEFSGKIRITEVSHDYRGLFRSSPRFKSLDQPCVPDLSCDSTYNTIGRSVCLLIINGNTYCTGTLINNTANNGKPYLLTASHCLENNTTLGSRIVAFLNYLSPRCDTRIRGSEEFSVSGSVTRALSNEVDFALVELNEMPPVDYRPYLAGWSLSTDTKPDLPFTCIHHPYGEVKKYCVEEDSVVQADWTGGSNIATGNHWYISQWDLGHTWAGSSGSALFDKNDRLRGGLTGGGSGGTNGGCEAYSETEGDYYFRIDRAWSQFSAYSKQLKHWLDPLTPDSVTSTVITLDGLDPYATNPAKRINNLMPSDSMGTISIDSPGWGSLFGHNCLATTLFAEHFTTTDSSMILGAYLIVAKGTNNSDLPVTIRFYKGGDLPGKILGKAILNPNYTDYVSGSFVTETKEYFSNRENYLRLDTPISVGTDFYVGYSISYPLSTKEDSFYVYAALRESGSTNTAFYKRNGTWTPYTKHTIKPVSTSLWIEPLLAKDTLTTPNTYYESDSDTVASSLHPVVAWSGYESILYIAFPDEWTETTTVDIYDLTGRKVLSTVVSPPLASISIPDTSPRMLLLRLKSSSMTSTLKAVIGFR